MGHANSNLIYSNLFSHFGTRFPLHFQTVTVTYRFRVADYTLLLNACPFCFQAKDVEDLEDLHAFPVRDPDTVFDWENDDTFAPVSYTHLTLPTKA